MDLILFYEVTPEYMDRRGEYRAEHLRLAWEYADRGELLIGGALEDPVDGAVLVFRCPTRDTMEKFVARDPSISFRITDGGTGFSQRRGPSRQSQELNRTDRP